MFYSLDRIPKECLPWIGKKGESLATMMGWGLPVPMGAVVTTQGFDAFITENRLDADVKSLREQMAHGDSRVCDTAAVLREKIKAGMIPDDLKQTIEGFTSEHGNIRFAVRSSGTKEDLGQASFAGQYQTILNVKPGAALLDSLRICWASLFGDRVLNYCMNRKIDFSDMGMAVVIQAMVPALKSGVIFTVDPLKGFDRHIIIEACFGLGEALVEGEVTPDQYTFDWYQDVEVRRVVSDKKVIAVPSADSRGVNPMAQDGAKRHEAVLTTDEVRHLASLALAIQAHYGFPVDIEWARDGEAFYILQSRPVTSISYSGIENEWTTADFRDGGVSSTVCSPFMWSLYDLVWERVMPDYLLEHHLVETVGGVTWGDMFYGRPYWNLSAVKEGLKRLPGYIEKDFDESLGIRGAYQGAGFVTKTTPKTLWTGIRVLYKLSRNFRLLKEDWPVFRGEQQARLEEFDAVEPHAMAREDFFAFYGSFIKKEYFRSEYTYFNTIFASSNTASLFKDRIKPYESRLTYANLISGLTNLSHLLPMYDLWDLREIIKSDADAHRFWRETAPEELARLWREGFSGHHMDAVADYIEQNKFHSTRELDITEPRYGEDPVFVMESLKHNLDLPEHLEPRALNKKQYSLYRKEKKKLLALVPFYKRRGFAKALHNLRKILWWREELRDLSTRFYHQVRRFTIVMADHFMAMKVIDQKDDIFFLTVSDIIAVSKKELAVEKARDMIRKNRLYYQSFRNYTNPNEIGHRYVAKARMADSRLKSYTGIPCSSGQVTGKIKVIQNIQDASRLVKGDILVTKFTDPGWTPKFSLLSGVITESGGLLSHAAVISREYGIPAILAVDNITSLLCDGQEVTIDGDRGIVTLS